MKNNNHKKNRFPTFLDGFRWVMSLQCCTTLEKGSSLFDCILLRLRWKNKSSIDQSLGYLNMYSFFILCLKPKRCNFSDKHLVKKKMVKFHLKPSLSTQWSLVRSFLREFFCIRIVVWLWSQGEVSRTKLMQKKSSTKLRMRLHWLERLGWSILLVFFLLLIHYQLSCQKGFASIQLLFECNYVFICSVHL